MLRKAFSLLLTLLILWFCSPIVTAQPRQAANRPQISATSAILVDAKSGQILYEKNSNERRAMASTTKMMTGIITLEHAKLNEKVTVSKAASEIGESGLYLTPGTEMSVQDLLYGLLLRSGNDTAAALAEHVSGSLSGFAALMNRKAKSIGAMDTNFANAHGLYDPNHYSTAYDIALIARYCLKDRMFRKIVATKEYVIARPASDAAIKVENHNKLLWQYPYATGIKTGFIRQAGFCLVSSANKNGVTLVSVILNSPTSASCTQDSINLLEYGFNQFSIRKIIKKGKTYKRLTLPEIMDDELEVVAARDLVLQVDKTPHSLEQRIQTKNRVTLPVTKGQKMGEIEILQFGKSLGTVELRAKKTVTKPGRIMSFLLWLKLVFKRITELRLSRTLQENTV